MTLLDATLFGIRITTHSGNSINEPMIQLTLVVIGVIAIIKGEYQISPTKTIPSSITRILGVLIIISGIVISVPGIGWNVAIFLLAIAAVIAVVVLIKSKTPEDQ